MTASDARVGGALPVGVTHPTPDRLLLTIHAPVPFAALELLADASAALAGDGMTAVLRQRRGAVCQVWAITAAEYPHRT